VSQVAVSLIKVAVVGVAVLVTGSQVFAQARVDVLERIAPVGNVSVEGQPAMAQPAATPEAKPMAKEEPVPATMPEPAPTAAAPAVAEATGGAGAQLFVSKTCSACHGADANTPIMPVYPRLAGQNAQYLTQQMKDIKSGARNHGQTMLMKGIMAGVSDDEIKAIADWIGTL